LNLQQPTLWAGPKPNGARERWRDPATFRHGASLVARYGVGLCLGTRRDPDGTESPCEAFVSRVDLWCDEHVTDSRAGALRDMRRVLEASADALRL
jgi:hypothetical protein